MLKLKSEQNYVTFLSSKRQTLKLNTVLCNLLHSQFEIGHFLNTIILNSVSFD